jgi:hypothetical protein
MTDFTTQMAAFAKKAKGDVDRKVRGVTLNLFSSVILSSPVGNPDLWKHPAPKGYAGGRFRANWNCSVTAPDLSTSEAIDPGGNVTIAKVNERIGGAGSVTYLANALPYAERLEYEGWSSQSPAGMVRVNMARIEAYMAETK